MDIQCRRRSPTSKEDQGSSYETGITSDRGSYALRIRQIWGRAGQSSVRFPRSNVIFSSTVNVLNQDMRAGYPVKQTWYCRCLSLQLYILMGKLQPPLAARIHVPTDFLHPSPRSSRTVRQAPSRPSRRSWFTIAVTKSSG